jgi:hypothetical protein
MGKPRGAKEESTTNQAEMRNIPHIVRERLKAGAVGGHPDADVLTAFAELSLSKPDRATVLTHLASCANCREIVALALPPIQDLASASVAPHRSWFTWPAFRWGFATAGVAVIALGVVEFEHHRPAHSATIARQVPPAPISAETQTETQPAQPIRAPEQTVASKATTTATKRVARLGATEPRLRHVPAESHAQIPHRLQGQPALVAKQLAPNPPASASQMVEVQAQNAPVNAQAADAQIAKAAPADGSAAQFFSNSLPLTRAKPADIEPLQTGNSAAVLATPRWSITAVGSLQRSLDQGKTWQDIDVNAGTPTVPSGAATVVGGLLKSTAVNQKSMPAPLAGKVSTAPIFFRTVTAAGNEVWAGGSSAALFHSIDGGDHWARVLPSSSDAVLTGDVVSVDFSDAQHGTVTTSTPEIWSTTDGGQTWQKQ